MANVTNFIYCSNIQRTLVGSGNLASVDAMGVLVKLAPDFLPGSFSFSVLFSVVDVDSTDPVTIQVVFKDDQGNKLGDSGIVELPALPESTNKSIPKKYNGYNMTMDFRNIVFEHEGEYVTEVYYNGDLIGEKPIYVVGKSD